MRCPGPEPVTRRGSRSASPRRGGLVGLREGLLGRGRGVLGAEVRYHSPLPVAGWLRAGDVRRAFVVDVGAAAVVLAGHVVAREKPRRRLDLAKGPVLVPERVGGRRGVRLPVV